MDLEEYEFDIVWSPEKNLWVTTLMNGDYLITARAKGFKELNEIVKIIPGATTDYRYVLEPLNFKVPVLTVEAVCANDGKNIKNVFLELWKEGMQ
jgi:hypothetical protein